MVAFKVTLPSVAVIFASLPVVKSLPASNLTSLPVTLPFTVALFVAVMFAFSPAVTLPATVTSFAFTFTSFAATRFPVGVFSKLSVAVTVTFPFSALTLPLLVILVAFKVTLPSVAATFAFSSIFNVVAFNSTSIAPVTLPATEATFAFTVTFFAETKLPVAVLVKLFAASTVILPSVVVTVPLLVILVALRVRSLSAVTFAFSSTVKFAVEEITFLLLPDKFNPPAPLIVKSDPSLFVIFAESYFLIVNSFVAFIAPAAILIVDVFALSTLPAIEDAPVASIVFAVIDKGPP